MNEAKDLVEVLNQLKSSIDVQILEIISKDPDCSTPVQFDLGIKEAFLEIEQGDEFPLYEKLEDPSPMSFLTTEIIAGLLGKWSLIIPNNKNETWNNIKKYIKEETNEKVCKFKEYI